MRFRETSSARTFSELIFFLRDLLDGSLLRWLAKSQATSENRCPSENCFSISWPVCLFGRASTRVNSTAIRVSFISLYFFLLDFDGLISPARFQAYMLAKCQREVRESSTSFMEF